MLCALLISLYSDKYIDELHFLIIGCLMDCWIVSRVILLCFIVLCLLYYVFITSIAFLIHKGISCLPPSYLIKAKVAIDDPVRYLVNSFVESVTEAQD